MKASDSESPHPPPHDLDLRVANRLRSIAERQRAPDYLRERIAAGLDRVLDRPRLRFRWDLVTAGATGALLASAAALMVWLAAPSSTPDPGGAWFDVAMSQVTRGSFMETDEPVSLRHWLESRVGHTIDVPDIPDAQLLGGRLAYLDGIRGAAIEYSMHGKDLTYLMVPTARVVDRIAGNGNGFVSWSSRGYRIVMWKQGGGTRALVAPMPEPELSEIARHCLRTML